MVKNRNTFNTFNNKNTLANRNARNAIANSKTMKKTIGRPKVVTDARQKIIQKKRTHVVDARDVLASLAKTQDARAKLQQLRGGSGSKSNGTNVKQIGKHILQKTDKNGKICLVTNKNRATNSINNKIREQLGLAGGTGHGHTRPKKVIQKRKDTGPLNLRRTINNDYSPSPITVPGGYYHHPEMYQQHTVHPGYSGISPMIAPMEMRRPPMMEMPITHGMVSDTSGSEWKTYKSSMRSNGNFMEVDSDDDHIAIAHIPSRPGMTRIPSNVHSRLDAAVPASHGIMSQTKTKVVVPAGHRIVVSNLQSTVTQDDIRELFEDIGQLLVARLVRPGTAEVIYKNLKDAQKAVDTYHNRQLDGQPMKCLLVNKRPLNNPTAPAIKANEGIRKNISNISNVDKLIPDLSTIHKVLFQRH